MEEIWKDIVIEKNGIVYDYIGKYQVSNLGRVRNTKGRVLNKNNRNDAHGYINVGLTKDGKTEFFKVHRLVATMFIPNPNDLPMVNHKNEIKNDNRVENLEWCTAKYNTNYGTAIERRKMCGDKNPMYNIGEKHWNYGRITSEKTRRKISENHADFSGKKNPRAKKVICVETGQIFNTIKEANEWLGKGDVCNCCKGKRKTCGGYHWKYVEKEGDIE